LSRRRSRRRRRVHKKGELRKKGTDWILANLLFLKTVCIRSPESD
jgi:hypothetical protein